MEEPSTYDEYVQSHLDRLIRLSAAIAGDPSSGEDLLQEVLIKMHAQWDRVQSAKSTDAYVRRMVVNEHLSWRRKWARIVPRSFVDLGYAAPDPAAAIAERAELTQLLRTLPRQQQVVLALRYYEGLTDAEIAESMGCSSGTVRGYASRALQTLRRASVLDDLSEEGHE